MSGPVYTCPNGHEVGAQTSVACGCGAEVVYVPAAALFREVDLERGALVAVDPVMLMYAFRYALGRMSYAVGDVVDALIEHKAQLRPDWKTQIVRDVISAINEGRAGHDADIEKWRSVVEAFRP